MLKKLIHQYINDPTSDKLSYEVAMEYYRQGHTASAMGYFLRTAELTSSKLLAYKSLLYCSNALLHQGNRVYAAKGCVLHAISILPERPEAHFLYARLLEQNKEWQESYTTCQIALKLCDFSEEPLTELEYPGKYGFEFEKSVVCWHMGRSKECRELLSYLYREVKLAPIYLTSVVSNMNRLKMEIK
jgi:hypothetical protein